VIEKRAYYPVCTNAMALDGCTRACTCNGIGNYGCGTSSALYTSCYSSMGCGCEYYGPCKGCYANTQLATATAIN